jgi:hypothetical protein
LIDRPSKSTQLSIYLSLVTCCVCRVRSGSGTGSISHGERESNLLTATGDLPHDHKLTPKALFMSQLGYGSYGSGGGVTGPGTGSGVVSGMGLNIDDEEEVSREKRRDRRGEYGGSMGPLLNGAWAYEH